MKLKTLPSLSLALVVLGAMGCGGNVEGPSSTGTGGQATSGTTSGSGAQTGTSTDGGQAGQTSSTGQGGQGGQTSSTGQGGQGGQGGSTSTTSTSTTTTSGSGGNCDGACVTSADCPPELPVCTNVGGCNVCLGPCNGAQCSGANTCITDAVCPSPDGKCVCGQDGCTMCVLDYKGGPPGFPAALFEGVWLIGWSGGLDHFSWVKFTSVTETTGTYELLDPIGVTTTPFYPCEGSGTFTIHLGTAVVTLNLPAACNMPKSSLDFLTLADAAGYPPHATKTAQIQSMGQTLEGYLHPSSFCDAAFTACGDPFLP